MNYAEKRLIGVGLGAAVGLCAVAAEMKSPWLVGKRYETTIKYDIVMKNVRIEPTDKYGYFETPQLTMTPTYHYVTDNITTNGVNWWAFRRYDNCQNTIQGLNIKAWKFKDKVGFLDKIVSIWDFYVPPRKYVELKDCKAESFFNVFDEDANARSFNAGESELLIGWNESILHGNKSSTVKLWDIPKFEIKACGYRDIAGIYRKKSEYSFAKCADAIKSEMKLYGSTMFETEVVAFEKILRAKDGKRFRLDVTKLHGLLMPAIRQMIEFRGDIIVEKTALKPSETKEYLKTNPFDGMKLAVVQSDNLEISYRKEEDEKSRRYYSLEVPNAQRLSDTIELLFDSRHGFLRYALIRLTIPNYEGEIPNPKLGRILKNIQGQISGDLVFCCEYFTDVGDMMTEDRQ